VSLILLLFLGTILGSTSIISAAAKSGYMQGGLTRGLAGGTLSVTSSSFLYGYTNLESFLTAAANGSLGFAGFVFIGGLFAVLITWVSNLINYEVAIR